MISLTCSAHLRGLKREKLCWKQEFLCMDMHMVHSARLRGRGWDLPVQHVSVRVEGL